jgi:Lipoprotein amino terminal region
MQKAALPVSSLINTYCQLNDNEPSNADVTQIIKMFEDVLSYNCRVQNDEQIARMLTALRAIGNAGRGAQSAVATLTRCANNEASPMSVRVAAVNAFRRIDCNVNNVSELNPNNIIYGRMCIEDAIIMMGIGDRYKVP